MWQYHVLPYTCNVAQVLYINSLDTPALTMTNNSGLLLFHTATMSNSNTALPPTFEELRAARRPILQTPDARRIFWSLDGPLSTSIQVMEDSSNPDSLEPYFRQTTGGTSLHPISELPLTDPKISSVTVHVYDFDRWEEEWEELHNGHVDLDGAVPYPYYNDNDFETQPLSDDESEEDDEGPQHTLLKCCGLKRPSGKAHTLVVKPTVSGKNFITVHDYLSAVHPWLMSLREDILWAKGVWDGTPLPANTKFMLDLGQSNLFITEATEWINRKRSEAAGWVVEKHVYVQ